jgi:hypothetical protein
MANANETALREKSVKVIVNLRSKKLLVQKMVPNYNRTYINVFKSRYLTQIFL